MYTKHRCRLRKNLQLPLTLKGSKEDLQFIRILPHPSNHLMYLFNVSVPFPYLRVLDILLYVETCKRHLLGGWFWLMFLDPTLWIVVSSTRSVLILVFPAAHKKSRSVPVAPVLSNGVWQFTLLYTSWRSAPVCWKMEEAVAVNLVGLKGRAARELHHSNSFSTCFPLNSSEKSSCISWTKKEFGAGQGKMQYCL